MDLMADLNQSWRMAGDVRRSLGPAQARRFAAALADGLLRVPHAPGLGAEIDTGRLRGSTRSEPR